MNLTPEKILSTKTLPKRSTKLLADPKDTIAIAKRELSFAIGAIPFAWQMIFLFLPLLFLFTTCFLTISPFGSILGFTMEHFTPLLNITYLKIILNSILISTTTSLFCLLIGFPLAYCIAFHFYRFRTLLIFLLILPFWTNFILHIFSWGFILEKHGLLNEFLLMIGCIKQPIHILNTLFATYFMSIYYYLPFMALPLYASMESFDKRLFEASLDLGATRLQSLQRILIPHVRKAIRVGIFLVFIPAFGEFIIPEFMGGDRAVFIGNAISMLTLGQNTGPMGVALTVLSICILLPAVYLFDRAVQFTTVLLARGGFR